MEANQFLDTLVSAFNAEIIIGLDPAATPTAIRVDADHIYPICQFLKEDETTLFDMLSCVTGLDNGPEANTLEVIYILYSIPLEHSLMLKTSISRTDPKIESLCILWQAANWHEREAFDLFGIVFNNHPDLRRILMPADWVGFPMRKDYVEPVEYRGMRTIREEEDPS